MIVLDEQMSNRRMRVAIGNWYKGKVVFLKDLRPGTIIKDDAVPDLLRRQAQPTFLTINVSHFWQRIPIDKRYCVVCFDIPDLSLRNIPPMLKLLFSDPNFRNKKQRCGHVLRITTDDVVQFYNNENPQIHSFQIIRP